MLNENEQLTHEHAAGYNWSPKSGTSKYRTAATKAQLMERLAAYEDTRLTPEEILTLLDAMKGGPAK